MDEKQYNVIFIDETEKIILETVLNEDDTDAILQNFYEGRNIGRLGNENFKTVIKASDITKIIAKKIDDQKRDKRITVKFMNGEEIHFLESEIIYTCDVVLEDYESDSDLLKVEGINDQDIVIDKDMIMYINVCEV